MKRPGSGERFLTLIDQIRAADPQAALRSSFIVGFPGETDEQTRSWRSFSSRRGSIGPASSRIRPRTEPRLRCCRRKSLPTP